MKNLKKLTAAAALLLAAAILPGAALADAAAPDETAPDVILPGGALAGEKEIVPDYDCGFAVVEQVGEDTLLVKTEDEQELQLNVGSAAVVDNKTGLPADLSGIKANDRIYYYSSIVTTMSLPPQSPAYVILTNVDEDAVPAHYLKVKSVEQGENCVKLLCGSVIVTVSDSAQVKPLLTKDIIRYTDLKAGDVILAWYDVVALSYPAQASTDRVVVLERNTYSAEVKTEESNGVAMVPLRECAEALGFDVEWNGEERSVTLNNQVLQSTVFIGTDSYSYATAIPGMVGMAAPTALGAAPYINAEGVSYVPAALFEMLGAEISVEDGMCTLTMA